MRSLATLGTLLKLITLSFAEIIFHVLCKDSDPENQEMLVLKDIDDASASAFALPFRAKRAFQKLPVPFMTSTQSAADSDRIDDVLNLRRAENALSTATRVGASLRASAVIH